MFYIIVNETGHILSTHLPQPFMATCQGFDADNMLYTAVYVGTDGTFSDVPELPNCPTRNAAPNRKGN